MPASFRANLDKFQQQNIGTTTTTTTTTNIQLWSNTDVLHLLEKFYDVDIQNVYKHDASPIQKADLARYAILGVHGGWYLDLDVGLHCGKGATKLSACRNDLHSLELFLQAKRRAKAGTGAGDGDGEGGTLFWERGVLSAAEMKQSARHPCRNHVPEYATRLSNYALHASSNEGRLFFRDVLSLAACRVSVNIIDGCGNDDDEYQVLFTTGPDVVTEMAYGNRNVETASLGGSGVGGNGGVCQTAARSKAGRRMRTAQERGMLVIDPKSMVMNANTFSWRNGRGEKMKNRAMVRGAS